MDLSAKEKFQALLRELFEFDCADLDFGIYRIMNYKRQVIEKWIAEDLPRAISDELKRGALAEQAQAQDALQAARQKVLDALGEDALDADGNLAEKYRATKAGREYLEAQEKARGARSSEALETAIYNHLYTFFSRYWQDGDFISKRRYSKKERYAIPYNGEEVYLYWANHDQYYVKTSEYFTDYTYKAPDGVTVHFKLQQADVEQNNVKGAKRFFLPLLDDITWDETARTLTIPFVFRPLTEQENITYGQKNQQEAIIARMLEDITQRHKGTKQEREILVSSCLGVRHTTDGKPITWLEHHLRQYTRRNTSDFFIHKDLRGFLSRELDFYLKNEVLNLDEIEAAGEKLAEGWFQLMRLIKRVGGHIIDFLAQIEDFQKMLWEKKKFITETFYVITVGNIPEAFYPEIAACEAQWEEWESLGFSHGDTKAKSDGEISHGDTKAKSDGEISHGDTKAQNEGEVSHGDTKAQSNLRVSVSLCENRIAFLKAHPTLPLDTRHFPQDFTDRLLASFDNLDEMTDGLLVHSENWQALNLLQEKYRERVRCIHIDPPYNTQTSGFLYKNDYQHSSWLAMMNDRLMQGIRLLEKDGILACHIDEYEMERLHLMFEQVGIENAGTLVWDKGMPTTGIKGVATQHEYVLFRARGEPTIRIPKKNVNIIQEKIMDLLAKYGTPTKEAISEYRQWLRSQTSFSKAERTYDQFDSAGRAFRSDNMSATDRRSHAKFYVPLVHPITGKPCPVPEYGWRYTPESMQEFLKMGLILFGDDESSMPRKKTFLEQTTSSQIASVFRSGARGKIALDSLGVEFPFAHPIDLYAHIVDSSTRPSSWVLDYFAGSGTTGHAVINLNREDGGRRKFILVEMAHYFDTVLLPRIKKVTFTPEWKDGKPKRMATPAEAERSPRIVKVIRLESYEDALNNLTFDEESGRQALELFKDDYLLHYMLRWETRHSATLLDVEKLQSPFAYKLRLHRDGETRERPVDLPETFAYLLGLDVETRRVYLTQRHKDTEKNLDVSVSSCENQYLVYRGVLRNGRTVAVIWRETKGWTKEDYERDRDFVIAQQLTNGADEVFVNGDSLIPGAQSLDPIFKERMFAGVE